MSQFKYLSFTNTRLTERHIFSLSAVHPDGNCFLAVAFSSITVCVLEAKICYVVKQLKQVSGHLITHTQTHRHIFTTFILRVISLKQEIKTDFYARGKKISVKDKFHVYLITSFSSTNL